VRSEKGEGGRVKGEGRRVEGGGWRVEGGVWRVEGGGWRVEGLFAWDRSGSNWRYLRIICLGRRCGRYRHFIFTIIREELSMFYLCFQL
jgi:hypothetical protein